MQWEEKVTLCSDKLDAKKQIQIANKTCQDAIICNLQYWTGGSGSVQSREDFEKIGFHDDAFVKEKAKSYFDIVNSNIGVGLMLAGPFFTACYTMGPISIESFMISLFDDIDFVKELMDIQLKGQLQVIETLSGMPFAFVEIADDIADNRGLMVMKDFYEEIWYPRIEILVKAVKNHLKVPIQFHCCGKLDDVLPYMVKLGVDAITPIQANCNDIYAIKKQVGNRLCISGNMAIEGVLAFGTPQEVIEDTKAHIDGLSFDGGYICASSHSICDTISPENYFAMIETAQTYGIYK